jgi:signal transduction histidine kinase
MTARGSVGRPAAPAPAATGVGRAHRFIVILLGLQRLGYVAPVVVSIGSPAFGNTAVNATLVASTIAWNAVMFWQVRRGGWFPPAVAWIDVTWAALLILLASHQSGAHHGHAPGDWSGRMGQAAAALAGAAIDRIALATLAVAVLLAAHAVATTTTMAGSPDLAVELVGCLNGLVWFAVVIGFGVRYLRRQGDLLDRLTDERVAAQARSAAAQARYSARLLHFRALHDTVLSTLAAIARGGLDHRAEQVRARCARDADYIRRLMLSTDGDQEIGTVGDALGRVVTDAEALGLRIRYRLDGLPADVPAEVADAFAGAAREALNNVARHSGRHTAWLTATTEAGMVVVRVVDRGVGFAADEAIVAAPNGRPGGFGLVGSVMERMRAVDGVARVSSAPGDGTCVELRWPA